MASRSGSIRFNIFSAAAVIPGSYGSVQKQTKSCLEETSGAKAFRCVSKNFRPALSTNSKYAAHNGSVARALAILYCAKFYHTLRSQHTDQMAQLIFDIAGNGDCVTDFFSQQELIPLTKPMQGLPE